VIVVAQRVSTILEADQILVLENGEIVGVGNHRELMGTCPTYVEIVESQLTPEQAAS
jgi:ATP-binding cassette subfamily B protein